MKEMKLIDGLFPGKTGSQRAAIAESEPKTALTTKRTFKISNDLWDDFVALAAAKKLTQAELVNELIKNAIAANRDLIEQYRTFFGEHKKNVDRTFSNKY